MKLNDIIVNGKKVGEKHDDCVVKFLPDGGFIHKFDDGEIYYFNKQGQLHRDNGPAAMYADGDMEWFQNGERHRTDGPAYIGATGTRVWYQNDKRHRDGGPAVILSNGSRCWFKNGEQIAEPRDNNNED